MSSATFSAKDVSVIVGGFPITGFESITINTNPRWEVEHDNEGSAIRVEQANRKYCTVDIAMKQTSTDQSILSGIYSEGSQVPVLVRDSNGTDLFGASKMSLELPTAIAKAKSALNDNSWQLKGNWTVCYIGGNT